MIFHRKTIGFIALILLAITNLNLWSQELELVAKLPRLINESSGVEISSENHIWTFNDSGGNAELYLIDTIGNLLKTLKITNSWNRDWEDITKDNSGNFYIGNIGNNSNSTKDLTIFKIPNPEKVQSDEVTATIISFSFEDQTEFPPSQDYMNFDCEAMIWHNDNIYLFSKHRSFPTATNLYRIPATEGEHIAKKIGTFYTGKKYGTPKDYGSHWVTAVAISPNGKKICLINGSKLWIFSNFEDDNFFDGECIEIDLGENTQKEGVCFVSDDLIYITDEYWLRSDIGGNLYKLNLN